MMSSRFRLVILGGIAAFSAAVEGTLSEINRAHWLLHASEEIHRSFQLLHSVRILHLQASGNPPQLCTTASLSSVTASRRQYEESWTTVYAADSVQALFDGGCFATSPGTCASYTRCENVDQTYPEERDPVSGLQRFMPESDSLQALHWALSQGIVQAWQTEQAELLSQLGGAAQDSEQESYLRQWLIAAAGSVDLSLRTENQALAHVAAARIAAFKTSVDPSTAAPPTVSGAPILPQSLTSLAVAIQSLIEAVLNNPCSAGRDWAGLRQEVSVALQNQADALVDVDAESLLQPATFDYTWRASEALIVGVSLALQSAALSALAEFECQVTTNPRSVIVPSVDALRKHAHELLQQLSDALPEPTNIGTASMPLQRCFARRVAAVRDAISVVAATAGVLTPPLLSLDFCERLFQATANQVISVSPYTETAPSASNMELFASSSEERSIHFDVGRQLAYVDPYAQIVERPSAEDGTAFATGDKMIRLGVVEGSNVRRVGPKMEGSSSFIPCVESNERAIANCNSGPPCQLGCYEAGYGTMCVMADNGQYADGRMQAFCPGDREFFLSAHFYMQGWHNSSCPFLCRAADAYQTQGQCAGVGAGFYSPQCNNSKLPCSTPAGMPPNLFRALVTATSSGQGSPLGCEFTLAFPFVLSPPAVQLTAPFTVELFVKVAVRDIPSTSNEEFAILAGVFPHWFVALRRASENSVQIAFYHAAITRAPSSRQDSLVDSETIPWTALWRHIAVVVKSTHAFAPNIEFYCDGSLVSSAKRAATAVDTPQVPLNNFQVFHVGPPNMQLFSGVLQDGRREPYFNVSGRHLYFRAELDEIRVHSTALSGLALGVHLTELRQHVACNVPSEALEGSTCRPTTRLTAAHTSEDRSSCKPGFETCGSRPGMCVAKCKSGMLKQSDCTCECPSGQFQVWLVRGIQLRGSGSIRNVTVFDAEHRVVEQAANMNLDLRIALGSATRVAAVTVRGGGSASAVSLYVETAADDWLPVPAYQNVDLLPDRDLIFHHRRLHEFTDSSFECAICPGNALGSTLPRLDALACACADGYGRSLLGRCEPRRRSLPSPLISPKSEFHTAGTRVRLSLPTLDIEGPWLTEIRYELGEGQVPDAPSCVRSPKYVEEDDGREPGLDIIKRRESVIVRAVLCHPLHFASPLIMRYFTGNDHLEPPRCAASGPKSTATTYAMQVNVTLTVDNEPDARILYKLRDGSATDYLGPILLSNPGDTVISAWATKTGFDTSMTTECRYSIDGAARVVTKLSWFSSSEPQVGGLPQVGGFVHEEKAFLVRRDLQELKFSLQPEVPGGGSLAEPVHLQYRLLRKPLTTETASMEYFGDWEHVGQEGTVSLIVDTILWASHTTTKVRVEWKAKEKGFVWSSSSSLQLIFLATRTPSPMIEATPVEEWGMADHWNSGPQREAALRQVHYVEIRQPTTDARLVFTIGAESLGSLIEASAANASSIRNGALVERLQIIPWSHELGPDELATGCGTGIDSSPRLCYYLGRFRALAGTTIQAFALQSGQLESVATVLNIAKREDPGRGQAAFQASVELVGPRFSIGDTAGLFVLPTNTDTLQFSLGLDGMERQSCVVFSLYSHNEVNSSSALIDADGSPTVTPEQLDECHWLPYKGQRMLERAVMYERLGLPSSAATSLLVTVLTSVRRPTYLWAYPHITHFLWLRDRATTPSIIGVVAPGSVPTPAAMVWLQEPGADVRGPGMPSCYFSVSHIPIQDADLQLGWLQVVPKLSAPVPQINDAMQPTDSLTSVKKLTTWQNDVQVCSWPDICELPLNGLLPMELIQAPAALPWVCAWAILPGYIESTTKCARIEMSHAKVVRPAFIADGSEGQDAMQDRVVKVGEDTHLGAVVVILVSQAMGNSETTRQLSTSARALTLFLERSHPLQYRFASVAASPELLLSQAPDLLNDDSFSRWQDLSATDPAPRVLLPAPGKNWPAEHALVAVDVRLMVGINSWSQQERSYCIVLQGRQPALEIEESKRTISLKIFRNGTILYRWATSRELVPRVVDNNGIIVLQEGFKSIRGAYKLGSGIEARLQVPGTAPLSCVAPTSDIFGADELQAEDTVGPRLCSVEASADTAPVQLSAPDGRHWILWAVIYSPGLAMSPVTIGIVEAQCVAPANVSDAMFPLCSEGHRIDSGQTCSAQCQDGFAPSESKLYCRDGVFSPSVITCVEKPCKTRRNTDGWNWQYPPCAEGASILSGSICTSQCRSGFVALVPSRTCQRGKFFPKDFQCGEAPCSAPLNIFQGANPSCTGLESIASGNTCTPQCQSGYTPTETVLECFQGTLSPSSFQCSEAPCSAPSGIRYASTPACKEGQSIGPQGTCHPRCQSGFAPSESILTCSAGVLQPGIFACDEMPCGAPADIANSYSTPCNEGQRIRPGDSCTARCLQGFVPSHAFLACTNGSLSPSTFTCKEKEDDIFENVILICVGVAVIAFIGMCGFTGAVMWMRKNPIVNINVDDDNPLEDWNEDVNSVVAGICVFCQTNPVEVEGMETTQWPPTVVKCCSQCAQYLPIRISEPGHASESLNSMSIPSGNAGVSNKPDQPAPVQQSPMSETEPLVLHRDQLLPDMKYTVSESFDGMQDEDVNTESMSGQLVGKPAEHYREGHDDSSSAQEDAHTYPNLLHREGRISDKKASVGNVRLPNSPPESSRRESSRRRRSGSHQRLQTEAVHIDVPYDSPQDSSGQSQSQHDASRTNLNPGVDAPHSSRKQRSPKPGEQLDARIAGNGSQPGPRISAMKFSPETTLASNGQSRPSGEQLDARISSNVSHPAPRISAMNFSPETTRASNGQSRSSGEQSDARIASIGSHPAPRISAMNFSPGTTRSSNGQSWPSGEQLDARIAGNGSHSAPRASAMNFSPERGERAEC